MAQRNLIREGFVYNTRMPNGTVSGSQYVTPGQINDLVNEDFVTTALTVSGSHSVVLDADLGARWKLDKVELYTAETNSSNFTMQISENNIDFRLLTMTGSSGLWVGTLPTTTISGSPRYLRYRHTASSGVAVQEWRAVNDETLLDFGSDGSQTTLSIDDSPIGGISGIVEPLVIKNNYSKAADGFVFVDRTNTEAEDEIEISLSPNGPWFGRNSSGANQPSNLDWGKGQFLNSRVVPSGLLSVDFSDGTAKGWSMVGATQTIVDGKLRGSTTTTTPKVYLSSEFVSIETGVTLESSRFAHINKFAFRAADADVVRVRAQVPSAVLSNDYVQGPRLFWKTEQNVEASPTTFRAALSVASTAGDAPLTSNLTDFMFNVGDVPTWSGTIRGLAFQPFTTSTGLGYMFDFVSVDVLNSAGNSIGLVPNPVHGATDFAFSTADFDNTLAANSRAVISNTHTVQQDCIITKVGALMADVQVVADRHGICLVRTLPGGTFPAVGANFTVPYAISLHSLNSQGDTPGVFQEANVFWQAMRGDRLALVGSDGGATNWNIRYVSGQAGASWATLTESGTSALTTTAAFASRLNSNVFVSEAREYLLYYDAVSPELMGYKATGTYRTPVLDAGTSPSLAMLDYDQVTPANSSIDSLGQSGFDSVRARGNDRPPFSHLSLGEVGTVAGSTRTLTGILNAGSVYTGTSEGPYQINTPNTAGVDPTNTDFLNLGLAPLYHEEKGELWVLHNTVSGVDPFVTTDVGIMWDVYDPTDGTWLRTDHTKGILPYGYDNPEVNAGSSFTGRCFVADYNRGEIYIVQRSPAFSLGAGTYFGLVTDLDGNYKDLIFREDTIGTSDDLRFFRRIRAFAYAEDLRDLRVANTANTGVFFAVHDPIANVGPEAHVVGSQISAFRNGDSVTSRAVTLINTKNFSDISGLGFMVSDNFGAKALAYNRQDGRLYVLFDNLTGTGDNAANRKPELKALGVSFNTTTGQFDYAVVPTVSGTAYDTAPLERGFSRRRAGVGVSDNAPSVDIQAHDYSMGMAHNPDRDTFVILRSLVGNVPHEFPDTQSTQNEHYYHDMSVSFLYECGAATRQVQTVPAFPNRADSLWGTLSGTLTFDDVASQGVNFPTGRFVQVEYQLNASSGQLESPLLTSSKIAQGLRIGEIPAGGSKEIYLRTNIAANKPSTLQQGRIKVFWESLE